MATHYIENASSGNQYYFNTNNATTSQSYQTYTSPVRSTYSSSTYSAHPVGASGLSSQQSHFNDSYLVPQQYQSVAGINTNLSEYTRHQAPQTRATARAVNYQDRYSSQHSPQPIHISPQHHHFQFDNRQQPGHADGTPVVYQTPGAARFTHHNVDIWTEGPSQNLDHHVQAPRVSSRTASTSSPQRHQDSLQDYYSQLTPAQHQHLLRQQQIQRQQEQQEQAARLEQQHRVTARQISVSPHNQSKHARTPLERQIQDEQDYYAAQRHMAAQRAQQQQEEEQSYQPAGIRDLMNRFTGPATAKPDYSKSKLAPSRHHSSSSHATKNTGPRQPTTPRPFISHPMTYTALPKTFEPPVNSVEYYQMMMQKQDGNPFTNIQQAAAPSHIQHASTGLGSLRERFKTGQPTDDFNQTQVVHRQQQQQSTTQATGGSHLSSIRDYYMNQVKHSTYDDGPAQQVHTISRTIVGEDLPQKNLQPAPQVQVQQQKQPVIQAPPPQQQQAPAASIPQQQPAPTAKTPTQEQSQTSAETVNQSDPSAEAASPPTTETTTA